MALKRGRTRFYFHGDLTEDGRWYSARGDAFLPLPFDREPTISDIRRLRIALDANDIEELERYGFYRPLDAPNLFISMEELLLPPDELDRRLARWFHSDEYQPALKREWKKIYGMMRRTKKMGGREASDFIC